MRFRPLLFIVLIALIAPLAAGCSGQKGETATEVAEQAPPPAGHDSSMDQAPPPPPASTGRQSHPAESVPEERPRRMAPPAPAVPQTITLSVPQGTEIALVFGEPLTSESANVGDAVMVELKAPVLAGDRVAFPAGSRVEGRVSDVKRAKKGFKDTGGAIAVTFDRIVGPDGRKASITAGFTKVAEGSAGKKAAIIGGSTAGGAILGDAMGKDAKGSALIGAAIGTAVAAGTKGREAKIEPGEEIAVALEKPARVTVKR